MHGGAAGVGAAQPGGSNGPGGPRTLGPLGSESRGRLDRDHVEARRTGQYREGPELAQAHPALRGHTTQGHGRVGHTGRYARPGRNNHQDSDQGVCRRSFKSGVHVHRDGQDCGRARQKEGPQPFRQEAQSLFQERNSSKTFENVIQQKYLNLRLKKVNIPATLKLRLD